MVHAPLEKLGYDTLWATAVVLFVDFKIQQRIEEGKPYGKDKMKMQVLFEGYKRDNVKSFPRSPLEIGDFFKHNLSQTFLAYNFIIHVNSIGVIETELIAKK